VQAMKIKEQAVGVGFAGTARMGEITKPYVKPSLEPSTSQVS